VGRYYNPRVTQVSKAKDFLVEQTALDSVPLSDLEKRMMYFTEGPDATEDSVVLNDEFETEYDMPTYEAKMPELLHRAYARVKKENPQTARTWNRSIRILRKDDHYLLVLWNQEGSIKSSANNFLKVFTVVASLIAALVGLVLILDHYGVQLGSRRKGPNTSNSSLPPWLQGFFVFLMFVGYGYYVVVPWMTKRLFRKRKSDQTH
jgi:hypothetical protein